MKIVPILEISKDTAELTLSVQKFLQNKLAELLSENGLVNIGVSGGSMPPIFCNAILAIPNLDWERIRIFMCDERHVPLNDPDSNFFQYLKLFPEERHSSLLPIPLSPMINVTSQSYEKMLKAKIMPEILNGHPRFDLLFLGVGPDGHTCSIFPDSPLHRAVDTLNWVAPVIDSPKPPPHRITLTLPSLMNAKNVAFIIEGEKKAEIVKGMYENDKRYPASFARPSNGHLWYFLDEPAASHLPKHFDN